MAAVLGATAGLAGPLASYHAGMPAGPVVAVLAVAEVAAAVLARPLLAHARTRIVDRQPDRQLVLVFITV